MADRWGRIGVVANLPIDCNYRVISCSTNPPHSLLSGYFGIWPVCPGWALFAGLLYPANSLSIFIVLRLDYNQMPSRLPSRPQCQQIRPFVSPILPPCLFSHAALHRRPPFSQSAQLHSLISSARLCGALPAANYSPQNPVLISHYPLPPPRLMQHPRPPPRRRLTASG